MHNESTYHLTEKEHQLATNALGGITYLILDHYRDEHASEHGVDWESIPPRYREAAHDIAWLLDSSASKIDAHRKARLFDSLELLREILVKQSDPAWWESKGAPSHLTDVRQSQLRRLDELVTQLHRDEGHAPDDEPEVAGYQFVFSWGNVDFEVQPPVDTYEEVLAIARRTKQQAGGEHGYFYIALLRDPEGNVQASGGSFTNHEMS